MMFAIEIIAGIATLILLPLLYVKWLQTYWSRKNVPTIKTRSILGNAANPFQEGIQTTTKHCYDEFRRRKEKHGGIYLFMQAVYMPLDIELIKNILTKDFAHFVDHAIHVHEKIDPLSAHLFNLEGEKWRNMRAKLTPTFTSGKMKMMFKTLLDCGVPLIDHIDSLSKKGEDLNIKEILSCYTTDIIGSCAFGLECNSFKDPDAEFRRYGRKFFTPKLKDTFVDFLTFMCPDLVLKNFPIKTISADVETFFINIIKSIMDYRTTKNIKRNDFIQIFIEMQDRAKAAGIPSMTLEQIAAQSFVFFLGGFETSSTTMTFCLHELAFNPSIQDKLREEIREELKKNGGVLTYDAIMGMKYMDKVINETLRKYPPAPMLHRECSLDYNVPDTDLTIKAGTKVFISNLGIHRDPEYYPKPDVFDPERFSEENKASRPAFSFLPFGEGPRICIGLRFGVMQAKTGLSMILDNYRILPGKGEEYDIQFDPKSLVLTKKGKVMLRTEQLSNK